MIEKNSTGMTTEEMLNSFISGIRAIVDPQSKINMLLGSILCLELHLKDEDDEEKTKASECINELLKLIEKTTNPQIILTVINDENDKYVRIMGEGLKNKELEFPK